MAAVFGRETELGAVDKLLLSVRHGLVALVLEGDPGIGKTTVWRMGIAHAGDRGYHVLSCRAAATEARLSFAALGDLLATVEPAAFDTLPDPQRLALDTALLRSESRGVAANPRAIGTGIVTLLRQLAVTAPILLAIDDLQWLDLPSARALEFALRRLESHPIAVLMTVRLGERGSGVELLSKRFAERVQSLRLGPLGLSALYHLVAAEIGRSLPRPLLIRIERACGGNPFYALEIARSLGPDAGAAGNQLPVPDNLRELVVKRLQRLPQRTREALLKVSALAQPTIRFVDPADLAPAEEVGVVRVGANGRIELTHPLFGGAIYVAASHARRREVHAELAEVAGNIEERARHLMLARANDEADEHLASVLHEAAGHALRRGAVEVAADLEEQAARRTPQMETQWERCLRAARHYIKAGDPHRSKALCEEVLGATSLPSLRAHALGLLAEAYLFDRPHTAIPMLEEALACVGEDTGHAARLEIALGGALAAVLDVARSDLHLMRAVELAERAGDAALVGEAIAMKQTYGLIAGKGLDDEALKRALALEDLDREVPFQMRVSMNVAQAYMFTGRLDLARELYIALRQRLVARGDEADLGWVLAQLGATAWLAGDLDAAERETTHAERIAILTGVELFRAFALMIRAMVRGLRGDTAGARSDGTEALTISQRIAWPYGTAQASWALALLAMSEASFEMAAAILEPVVSTVEAVGIYEWPIAMVVPDAIEAFVASGKVERAARLTDMLGKWGRKFDRPWALATSSRCRALLEAAAGDLERASADAEQALVEHERLPMPFELGRTLLVLGRLQRRRGARRLGLETLQRARMIFERLGTPLWAERAVDEIARIGVRRAPQALTEGERRVAELAAQGFTNPEIASQLFMSRRTVEANLARVYRKLGIRSRAELGAVMAKRRGTTPF
jgi:DNA-binding CsgD family transcriptional regulator